MWYIFVLRVLLTTRMACYSPFATTHILLYILVGCGHTSMVSSSSTRIGTAYSYKANQIFLTKSRCSSTTTGDGDLSCLVSSVENKNNSSLYCYIYIEFVKPQHLLQHCTRGYIPSTILTLPHSTENVSVLERLFITSCPEGTSGKIYPIVTHR